MIHTTVCTSLKQGTDELLRLTEPAADPFIQDWVICPHPESAKWVSRELASSRGLCAQVEIYPVGQWVGALQSIIWPELPMLPPLNRLIWAVLEGAPMLGQKWGVDHEICKIFGPPPKTNETELDQRRSRRRGQALPAKRLQAAKRYAKHLRRLLLNRPHWLQRWDSLSDDELSHDVWPALWRETSKTLGPIDSMITRPDGSAPASWADWLELLCRRASNAGPQLKTRVRRIIFFGHHRYDAPTLALARACAQSTELAFLSLDPVFLMGSDLVHEGERAHHPVPLLASYGGGFSAFIPLKELRLGAVDHAKSIAQLRPPPPFPINPPTPSHIHRSSTQMSLGPIGQRESLLTLFVGEIAQGQKRPEAPELRLTHLESVGEDHSLRFHSSYSDQRQVEDLYQTLMGAFRRDASLRPRDVLVLCPDIERFTPLILAVFNGDLSQEGISERGRHTHPDDSLELHRDSIRLGAEISRPHGQNAYAHLLTVLLKLATGRLYRHDVFAWLKHPLVSTRYRLSLSELLKLEQWVRLSGVRWGLDADHRVECGLNREAQHSWEFGLDRLLMGTLVGEDQYRGLGELYGGVAPIPLGGEEIESLLSRFCEAFMTLKSLIPKLSTSHTPAVWCELLIDALRAMTAPSDAQDRAARQDVESDLRRSLKWRAPTQQRMTSKAVSLLIEGVGEQRSVIGGGRDHIRFYPLDQAYSVPAKVICFLNMSEGRFPQRDRSDRIDPLREAPLPTDLDPLQEQFANLISTVLATEQQLHFFYTGQKASGEHKLPAPIIQAIQEEISARYQISGLVGDALIEALTTRHPLHSFSPRNFIGNHQGIATEETLSHDSTWLKGAQAWREAMSDPKTVPPFADRGLEVAARGVSRPRLDTLKQLFKNPSEYFIKRGVGMHLLRDEELTRERELLELDHLQSWQLQDRSFKLLMAMDPSLESDLDRSNSQEFLALGLESNPSADPVSPLNEDCFRRVIDVVRAEGLLPIGKMGEVSFEQAIEEVKSLYRRFSEAREGAPRRELSLQIELPSGRPISIETEQCFGHRLVFTTPSRYTEKLNPAEEPSAKGERLIEPWLYHVALSASDPQFEGTSLVAKDGRFDRFPPLDRQQALSLLDRWVDLMEDGALKPLRFDPDLSWKWLKLASGEGGKEGALESFEQLASKWKRADDIYVKQTYGEGSLWREQQITSSPSPEPSPIPSVLHPLFLEQSEAIFGALVTSFNEES